jgi:hypothetical protein
VPESERVVVESTTFVTHDKFFANAEVTLYDIAIIYLDSPVEGIAPVKLPAKSDVYPLNENLSVKAIGYGQADGMLKVKNRDENLYSTNYFSGYEELAE